jgi:hypothetical protein
LETFFCTFSGEDSTIQAGGFVQNVYLFPRKLFDQKDWTFLKPSPQRKLFMKNLGAGPRHEWGLKRTFRSSNKGTERPETKNPKSSKREIGCPKELLKKAEKTTD